MFQKVIEKINEYFTSPDTESSAAYDGYDDDDYDEEEEEEEDNMDDYENNTPRPGVKGDRGESKIITDKRGYTSSYRVGISIEYPKTVSEADYLCHNLRNNIPMVISLEDVDKDEAQRILDFVAGAISYSEGKIEKISKFIYLAAPQNVDVQNEIRGKNSSSLWRPNNRQD